MRGGFWRGRSRYGDGGDWREVERGLWPNVSMVKTVQAEGVSLYWPLYNLDLKHSHAKAGLEHADPDGPLCIDARA